MINNGLDKEQAWKKKFKIFREVGKLRVSSIYKKDQPLLAVLEGFINMAYQEGCMNGQGRQIPLSNEPSENEVWRIDYREVSYPPRTREKSKFVAAVLKLKLKKDDWILVSHKAWLAWGGDKGSVASQKNGPRQTLKRNGLACYDVRLDGEDLQAQSEFEERELTTTDKIYEITPLEKRKA